MKWMIQYILDYKSHCCDLHTEITPCVTVTTTVCFQNYRTWKNHKVTEHVEQCNNYGLLNNTGNSPVS